MDLVRDHGILVLDAGTTSTRAAVFTADGNRGSMAQLPLGQQFPRPGWVEQDADEIFEKTVVCARRAIAAAGGSGKIAAIGIANQRETVVAWDKRSGKPVCPAIVWQDRRTAKFCEDLRLHGVEAEIQRQTGLLVDPYFSASKMRWILHNIPEAVALGDRLAFGTVKSWIVWKLTNGLHISDATNASRTMLCQIEEVRWEPGLLDLFDISPATLPEIVPNCGEFGVTSADLFGDPLPITGMIGDQQSAMIGQGCVRKGDAKATLGTGAFVLASMGTERPQSANRLLATVLCWTSNERQYALEGSIFAAGSIVKWLRDALGLLVDAKSSEDLATQVNDNGGVVLVPAFAGLGAPLWRPDVTASLTGLTFSATRAHVVRAALESISHQCLDLKQAFALDGADWSNLKIDGGMSGNNWIAQDLADLLEVRIDRPVDVETTARGVAIMAALGAGIFGELGDAVAAMQTGSRCFTPQLESSRRTLRKSQWNCAVKTLIA